MTARVTYQDYVGPAVPASFFNDAALQTVTGGNTFTGAQTVTAVALTDGATISVDASLSNNFTVTLGGNRTLANPTNLRNGGVYTFVIVQDGTGSRTLSYGSKFKWPGATPPTLSTGAGSVDFIVAQYYAAGDILLCNCLKGFG